MANGTIGEFVRALHAKAKEMGFFGLAYRLYEKIKKPSFQRNSCLKLGPQGAFNFAIDCRKMIWDELVQTTDPTSHSAKLEVGHQFLQSIPEIATRFDIITITREMVDLPLTPTEELEKYQSQRRA